MALLAKYIHEFATDESASTYNYDLHNLSSHVSRESVEIQSRGDVHFTGVSIGALLSLMKNARNLAGLALLALRPTI